MFNLYINFIESTRLASIWNITFNDSYITEIKYPINQKLEITLDLSIEQNAQTSISIYANSFNTVGIQKLTETMPITTRNVSWGNTGGTAIGLTCGTDAIINNANIQTIDLSALGVPAGNNTGSNANNILANTPNNMYCGNYFPANSSNWNTVSLPPNIPPTMSQYNSNLVDGIFDLSLFNKMKNNWNLIQFGHSIYKDLNIGSFANSPKNLVAIMNSFIGLLYSYKSSLPPPLGTTERLIDILQDSEMWVHTWSQPEPIDGNCFGTICDDLDETTIVNGWKDIGNGKKEKIQNGVTWVYTHGKDSKSGNFGIIEAQVIGENFRKRSIYKSICKYY